MRKGKYYSLLLASCFFGGKVSLSSISLSWSTMIFPWYYLPFQNPNNGRFFCQNWKSKGPERPSGHKWTWPLPTDPSRSLDWDHHRSSRCSSRCGFAGFGWLVGYKSQSSKRGEGSAPHHQNPDAWTVWIMKTYMSQVKNGQKMNFPGSVGKHSRSASGICAVGSKLPFFPYKRLEYTHCRDFRH